ncbi:MAG: hypothetical protein L6V80_06945 [Bacteroidales bacterium]|nr:MAG: hypothetical protein L6V80_06945 [Bacteroidales bacterium]
MIADNHKFDALELSMLPRDERTCVVNNEFIISDNFDEEGNACDLSSDPHMRSFITAPYPFKIQFAMVSLCVEGSMRLRLNLNEYESAPKHNDDRNARVDRSVSGVVARLPYDDRSRC